MVSCKWMLALVAMAAASVPSASRAQDWTSTSGAPAPEEATAPVGSDTEPRDGAERYQMRQKLVSFGDDFWIENGAGRTMNTLSGLNSAMS